MVLKILTLFIVAIVSFWISAICGGGASLILVPMLDWFIPASIVPFSLTVGTFVSSGSRIIVFKRHIRWNVFLWFVPFSIPAVLCGAWLIKYSNPLYLQLIVGLLLLANIKEFFKVRSQFKGQRKSFGKITFATVGFLAGFISGITGAIGLLFNRFYLASGMTKEEIIATRAANEIFLHFIKLIIYLILGLYSEHAMWFGVSIALASIVSSYTLKFILPFISEFIFRKIGYGAMIISGLALLIGTSQTIVQQDKISVSTNKYDERTIHWRNSYFVLEFAIDDGLEIERPISYNELPEQLRSKYNKLLPVYDEILLEKVFKPGLESTYEFYCLKQGSLTKIEINGKAERIEDRGGEH